MKTKHSKKSEKTADHTFQMSFDETADERAALDPANLLTINLDIPITLTSVMTTLPGLAVHRDMIAQLPGDVIKSFDKLETYAQACAHGNQAFLWASRPTSDLPELMPRAIQIRETLISDVTALAKHKLVDDRPLTGLKGPVGYLNVATDVGVLVGLLRERWADISNKSALQERDLDEARDISERMTLAYAARELQSAKLAAASDNRQRAYTVLLNAYDQTRRAVTFIRWNEGDYDKIAPSLWAGRGGRGGSAGTNVTPPAPPVAPALPNGNGNGASPVTPGLPDGTPLTHDE